jgi:hypothetical protein
MPLTVKLPSWEDFEKQLGELRTKCENWPSVGARSPLLFRGQENANWRLETTLERSWPERMSFHEFYVLINRVAPAVESHTDADTPEFDREVLRTFAAVDPFDENNLHFVVDNVLSGPLLSYMVYLRHHGFPSPLLDWSRSPYVAAFFAFRNSENQEGHRSIYVYWERPEGAKGGAVGEPTIHVFEPYVRCHPRHFRQQSAYTICYASDDVRKLWHFDSHQHVLDRPRSGQDYLWRFDIPSSERAKVLRTLDDHNLNAFSLFDTEEALLETMWLREQIFRRQTKPKE